MACCVTGIGQSQLGAMIVENWREVMRVLLSLQRRFYKLYRETNFKVPFDVALVNEYC
jgi:hypothetical protein